MSDGVLAEVELADTPESRCPCVLVLDVSKSVDGGEGDPGAAGRFIDPPLGDEQVFVDPETGEPWDDPYRLLERVCKQRGTEGGWHRDMRRAESGNLGDCRPLRGSCRRRAWLRSSSESVDLVISRERATSLLDEL